MVKDRIRSRGKQRSVKKDKVRRVKRSRKSSVRSRRSVRRSRKSSVRSNRRTRRSTRRSSRSMRGGANDSSGLDEAIRKRRQGTRMSPTNPTRHTRSPSPSASPQSITTEERMRELGLTASGLNEQLRDLYKLMAPEVMESVKPIMRKMLNDPMSYAISFAVVTAVIRRLISGDLGNPGGINIEHLLKP